MKRIAILETSKDPHLSSAFNIYTLFDELGFHPTLYTRNTIENTFNRRVIALNPLKERLEFLRRINENKFIIINTISLSNAPLIVFISLIFKGKLVAYVRNVNIWTKIKFTSDPAFNLRNFIHFIIRKIIKRKTNLFFCGSFNMANQMAIYKINPTVVIPFAKLTTHLSSSNNISRKEIIICIPGVICYSRKNIKQILSAFKNTSNKHIRITFLGKPKTKADENRLIQDIMDCGKEGKIRYYTTFIAENEFEFELSNCDIILGSINPEFKMFGYNEIYGLTKDSGLESHAIMHEKMFWINNNYQNEKFYPHFKKYATTKELTDLMNQIDLKEIRREGKFKNLYKKSQIIQELKKYI